MPRNKARRRARIRALLDALRRRGACQLCGERDPTVLDFHHCHPARKTFALGAARNRTFEAVAAEVIKCALVCANCHRRINAGVVDASGLVPLTLPEMAPQDAGA